MSKDSNLLLYGGIAALGVFILSSSDKTQQSTTKPTTSESGGGGTTGYKPSVFIKKYMPAAMESQNATGVPALVTLAQGGLESNWGKSAYGNNFFGIKAGKSWKGEIQKLKTWECGKTDDEIIQVFQPNAPGSNASCNSKGKPSFRVYGKFRAYDSARAGFIDHGKFLKDNKRYAEAFKYKDQPTKFGLEIAKAGYATAPNYAEVLIQTIINIKKLV